MNRKPHASAGLAELSEDDRTRLIARRAKVSSQLREALVAGKDTAIARRELREIEDAEVWIATEISEREAAQHQVEAERVNAAARMISDGAIARVDGYLADLSPPAAPASANGGETCP